MSTKTYPVIDYLINHSDDRAMMATLRRGLGSTPAESIELFPILMPFLKDNRSDEHMLSVFQVASLFALHPANMSGGNLGDHLKRLKGIGNEDATQRRFIQLLRLRRESLDAPLRQHIQLLKANSIPVDWHELLYGLQYWSHPDHFIQKKWAEAFWG